MDDVQLANYLAGTDPGPVEAWRLDRTAARALGVPEGTVAWISDWTLTKTQIRHPEVNFQDYVRLPDILSRGYLVPGNKRRCVEACYADVGAQPFKFWHAALKTTQGDEVFVTTLHRSGLADFIRIYRRAAGRGTVLRDHENNLARRLSDNRAR